MKPRIAIPQVDSASPDYAAKVMPQYCQAVELAGGQAVEVALNLDNHAIARLATTCDAVLLPGSRADINPQKYCALRDPHTAPADPLRDNADELLLQDAYNMHKPLLGICFGLQSLNVWRSGTLVQHLNGPVRHSGDARESAPMHEIVLAPNSRLADIVGKATSPHVPLPGGHVATQGSPLKLMVNSSHHQAVGAVGDGLRAVAWSVQDRVIEALEGLAPDHWVLAVQWHPERMRDDLAALALFRAFVEAARSQRTRPRVDTLDFESLARG